MRGLTVLVYGAAGGVGSIATQMAVRDGAKVTAIVRTPTQQDFVCGLGAHDVFLTSDPHLLAGVKEAAPDGVNRIAEVDFAGHVDFNTQIIAVGATISSYYSADARPASPTGRSGSPTPPCACSAATISPPNERIELGAPGRVLLRI